MKKEEIIADFDSDKDDINIKITKIKKTTTKPKKTTKKTIAKSKKTVKKTIAKPKKTAKKTTTKPKKTTKKTTVKKSTIPIQKNSKLVIQNKKNRNESADTQSALINKNPSFKNNDNPLNDDILNDDILNQEIGNIQEPQKLNKKNKHNNKNTNQFQNAFTNINTNEYSNNSIDSNINSPDGKYFIRAENLSLCIEKNICILNNITFNVSYNKVHGFIGPNGAGKTTFIKTMIDAYHKTSGKIIVDGYDNTRIEWKQHLGYIPESCRFAPNKKVIKVLEQSAYLSNISKKLLISKINSFSNKYIDFRYLLKQKVKSLSSGQQKIIMIFDALINNPRFLVFDEPTENLDPTHRHIFFKIIKDFISSGSDVEKGIFISSHVLAELKHICNEITIIKQGRIIYAHKVVPGTDLEQIYEDKIINEKSI